MYGPYLAFGTALCWMISALAFENASRRVGSVPVNLLRLIVAFALLTGLNTARFGQPLPLTASAFQWNYLLISGLLGFFVGDLALFRAFVVLGARLTTLLMCLAPPVAAVTEWLWLGNPIAGQQIVGMAITLGGVAWVVFEKPAPEDPRPGVVSRTATPTFESEARVGGAGTTVLEYEAPQNSSPVLRRVTPFAIFLGIVAAIGQGVGLVCTKIAVSSLPHIDAFAATQIRILAGILTFGGLVLISQRVGDCVHAMRDRKAMLLLSIGAVAGPFLGVSMLNKAVELISSGVAQTITSLVPVLIIPVSILVLKERVKWQAVLGAVVAVAGVALLVL